jgi:uncharacterized protein YdeI (YjbR/CyaY-like superfamily)
MNKTIENYLINGCMRCKYGATPQCKVIKWSAELELLRAIVLQTSLKEEIKWGSPVYTLNDKNIVSVNVLKDSANIVFFKGVLLLDNHKILQQQGNVQLGRIAKFTNTNDIISKEKVLLEYIYEAIEIEKSGRKLEIPKQILEMPDELNQVFDEEPEFKTAFYKLTPGRQRSYIIHFSQAKQSATRLARIHKNKELIFKGIGFNDKH